MKIKRKVWIYGIVVLTPIMVLYYVISLFECNAWMKAFPIQCFEIFKNEMNLSRRIEQIQNHTTCPHCSFLGFKRTITVEYQKENIIIVSYCRIHRLGSMVVIDENGDLAWGFKIVGHRKELEFDFRNKKTEEDTQKVTNHDT